MAGIAGASMSPLQIGMLLRYYSHANDYRDEVEPDHAHSLAVKDSLAFFFKHDLIEQIYNDVDWQRLGPTPRPSQYRVTPKGTAMVESLMAVQIPVCKWVQP